MPSAVRAGDVYVLQIPGDNGEIKPRRAIVLDGAPSPTNPAVVLIIFGCSETKRGARQFVRVLAADRDFAKLGLANATTFHIEDIRFYDASSPSFSRPPQWRCGHHRMLELRVLLEARLDQPQSIPLLPRVPSEEARDASVAYVAERRRHEAE